MTFPVGGIYKSKPRCDSPETIMEKIVRNLFGRGLVVAIFAAWSVSAAENKVVRQYSPGTVNALTDLPQGRFREQVNRLSSVAKDRVLTELNRLHVTELDFQTLHPDRNGRLYYVEEGFAISSAETTPPPVFASPPVAALPSNLILHSRPESENILYLNFEGEEVRNTAWNDSEEVAVFNALPYSRDNDYENYSALEQAEIADIWRRVSEDFAPFDINVTTQRPAFFGNRTAHALITRSTGANGQPNPAPNAGGVAYLNTFATGQNTYYSPAWAYQDNAGNTAPNIAEVVSHEVGHNLGLTHDGTDILAEEYYLGHGGTGPLSWGAIMGASYGRKVTQWSKGDYFDANNEQNDLNKIASLVGYVPDDHGDAAASATELVIVGGSVVNSTTPENDPTNQQPENKGVIESDDDVDVFSFFSGFGEIDLHVRTATQPTFGGSNLKVEALLYDINGNLLASNTSQFDTTARIQADLVDGQYFLHLRSAGAGSPGSSSPSGFVTYGSIGQYFISGSVVPSALANAPTAFLSVADITQPNQGDKVFTVIYTDNEAVKFSSLGDNDIRVTGPRGFEAGAALISTSVNQDAPSITATYAVSPPNNGIWSAYDDGSYQVIMNPDQVLAIDDEPVPGRVLGQFAARVPFLIYEELLPTPFSPGWSTDGQWQYGRPVYGGNGPAGGFTGSYIYAYNRLGNYPNNLVPAYLTTQPIPHQITSDAVLGFRRWLGLAYGDGAWIQVRYDDGNWVDIWRAPDEVDDGEWVEVRHELPPPPLESEVIQFRWGLSSTGSGTAIGWNIDDVQLLGFGQEDVVAPTVVMQADDLTGPAPATHEIQLIYTDGSSVNAASLDDNDLLVTGSGETPLPVTLVGINTPGDGSPRTATYAIGGPAGNWRATDNGVYSVTVKGDEVTDVFGNTLPETAVGTFNVDVTAAQFELSANPNVIAWGEVNPSTGTFTEGEQVNLTATANTYYEFHEWAGDATGDANPLSLTIDGNKVVTAIFAEITTSGFSTPHWWLAEYGFTSDFESAELQTGANGLPYWQSYVAGLDPTDPESKVNVTAYLVENGSAVRIEWTPVAGRLYTVLRGAGVDGSFTPLSGAENLEADVSSFDLPLPAETPVGVFRLEVKLE